LRLLLQERGAGRQQGWQNPALASGPQRGAETAHQCQPRQGGGDEAGWWWSWEVTS